MGWKKKFATGAVLTALASGTIYIINRTISFVASIDNLLSKSTDNYYEWRFGNIFYTKKGTGTPILLIHDLSPFSSAYEWNKIEDSLAKTNTVYTLDLLGCGRSDKPNITYTSFLYVQLITDFIKHIIGERVNIVSTGDSSSFTLLACNNDETIIDKIMLINPTSLGNLAKAPCKRTKMLKFLINLPLLGTLLYHILVIKRNVTVMFHTHYFYDPDKVEEKYVATYFEAAHTCGSRAKCLFASMRGRYTNMNIQHCLQNMNHSIFILIGNGNCDNLESAEQYQNVTPSIEVVPISKTKHLPQLEDPHSVIDNIRILFEVEE